MQSQLVSRYSKKMKCLFGTLFVAVPVVTAIFLISNILIAHAAIESTDYFQLTAAGNTTSMNAGESLVFTVNAKDGGGNANELAGSDCAFMGIHHSNMENNDPVNADVTAISGGAILKASVNDPWGNRVSAANIAGTSDTFVAINIDGTGTGTVTITATESFGICIGAPDATPNLPDSGEFGDGGTPPGDDCSMITVTAAAGTPDHLVASSAVNSAELNQEITYTIAQVNSGGGTDITVLADVGVSLAVDGSGVGTITKVNGEDVVTPGPSAVGMSLTAGIGTVTVIPTDLGDGNGVMTLTPSSVTLPGSDVADSSVTASIATNLTIRGCVPPNGQNGVPINVPIDFMSNKNPDLAGTIFPLTNTTSSVLSITSGGTAVTGQWNVFADTWGEDTFYRVAFQPSVPLAASTTYTTAINKSFAPATDLPLGMPALTDGGSFYSSSFTTGTGGGSFVQPSPGEGGAGGFNGGFTGTLGGEFPPMAYLSYPMPGMPDVPTNIACVTVGFDRPMKSSTLTTSNIYIKKIVNGTESTPSGTPVVTALQGNESVCISGYTFQANTDYRVIVTRDVTDNKGTQLAGMPESNGETMNGFGFGFENMGSFKEQFRTGSGSATATVPNLMGLNINQYKSGGSITGVPTGIAIRAGFGTPLNPSTVNSTNVTLKRTGTVPVTGSVFYDAKGNSIEFVPASALSASTSYTFSISSSVTSVSGTAVSAVSNTFTTGVSDIVDPQVVFADADNYGTHIQFNEPLNESTATDRSFYTVKTCSQAEISADGISCTGGGSVSTVSLLSGPTAHYDRFENAVWMDGLTLTAGDGFYIGVSTGVTDISGNTVHATNNKSWTGFVMDAGNFAGGQGMFNMGNIGTEDFDMGMMGMNPIGVMPMNTMAGATTKYFANVPIGTAIPLGGYIELTFPAGFNVSGVKRDAQSPINSDFNGPGTGTPTFATTLPTITGIADGSGIQANDGVGYISAARKVFIKLSAATQANDFLQIDLDGIKNSDEPKSFDTTGYSVDIKTFDTSNGLLEAMSTMPFFISSAGTGSVSGQVKAGAVGLNNVTVFLDSPMTGSIMTTTSADGAGTLVSGANNGEYKFENLPAGQYFLFTEPMFTSGATDYYGNSMPEPLNISGATIKNIGVTAATSSGKATQPITITFSDLSSVSSLGFDDSIDIFAFNPSSRIPVIKTVTRSDLGSSPYTVNLFLPSAGDWNIGIGPAMSKGPMSGGMGMMGGGWMPPSNTNVMITASDLDNIPKSAITFTMNVSDKSITGKVVDDTGTVVTNAEVYAYDPQAGKNAHATTDMDGVFTLNVTDGSYKVGAFLPGLPNSQETSVLINGSSSYVNGSATASTGSSGENPFYLKVTMPAYTVQGRVATSGGSAITGAAVWAHRTDAPSPPLHTVTNSSGNYALYVSAGTWQVEADAPNYGYLGSKTLIVSTVSLTNQNFEVASDLNTVVGTIDIPNTSDNSGTIVYAYGVGGSAEAKTDTDGNYTLNLPDGTYDIKAVVPGMGDLTPLEDVVVNGNETGQDFTAGTPQSFTITLSETTTEDTIVKLFDTNGNGNDLLIPGGDTTGTMILPEGTYYLDADVPGANFEDLTIAGAEFNNPDGTPVLTDQINIDGTGDNMTITLPDMYTITGRVTVSGSGINDVFISVYDQSTKEYFGVATANDMAGGGLDGEYSLKLQAGTYTLSADKVGYSTAPIDLVVSENSVDNDFALTASSRTIAGTVLSGGAPVANAPVWAEKSGGGFASTETSTDGTYTLNVDPGVWAINTVADGYSSSSALNVDVTSASESEKNFTSLTALTGADILQEPQTESITPSSGGTVFDENTNAMLIASPNALSTSTDSGQLSIAETNSVMQTPTANPIGNGYEISATDSDNNPLTILKNNVSVSFQLTQADLLAEGVDTPAEATGITNGYWDDSSGNWISLPTDCIYYDADGAVIPENTVAGFGTLVAASVDHMEFLSQVDHFTTFAPILPTGATPPATPSGLVASAGNGQVTLTWTKNTEEDMSRYDIWEANVTEGILTTLTQAECSTTSCSKTVSSLTNGTAYSFQIIAVDEDGNSSVGSTAASATPSAEEVVVTGGGGGGRGRGPIAVVTNTNNEEEDAGEEEGTEEVVEGVDDSSSDEVLGKTSSGDTTFLDIAHHWAKKYVNKIHNLGIVSGYDAKNFGPNAYVTRAELIKMTTNMMGWNVPTTINKSPFKDVIKSQWYTPYISTALEKGIVTGYSNKTFKPNKLVNRAEALKIVLSATGLDIDTSFKAEYNDVGNTAWYAKYINFATQNNIVSGYGNGKFGPNNQLTRAEIAKIISLMIEDDLVH